MFCDLIVVAVMQPQVAFVRNYRTAVYQNGGMLSWGNYTSTHSPSNSARAYHRRTEGRTEKIKVIPGFEEVRNVLWWNGEGIFREYTQISLSSSATPTLKKREGFPPQQHNIVGNSGAEWCNQICPWRSGLVWADCGAEMRQTPPIWKVPEKTIPEWTQSDTGIVIPEKQSRLKFFPLQRITYHRVVLNLIFYNRNINTALIQ